MSQNNQKKTNMASIVSKAQRSVIKVASELNDKKSKPQSSQKSNVISKNKSVTKKTKPIPNKQPLILKKTELEKPESSKDMLSDSRGNNHIVSLICSNIRDMHQQSIKLNNDLHEEHRKKSHTLTSMRSQTFDAFNILSNCYLDAVKTAFIIKNPQDILSQNIKAATQIHHTYIDLAGALSHTSLKAMQSAFGFFTKKS